MITKHCITIITKIYVQNKETKLVKEYNIYYQG